jgi:glycosyltransferase involved in cell wall biosynthesis
LKIALVTAHFAPRFEGGTELVARAQGRELARLGHAVRVVSGSDRPHAGRDVERAEVDGLPVAFLPRHASETYDLELARPRLAALVAAEVAGADLVHVHHWSTLGGALVRELSREAPVVVTLHDLFTTCPRFFRVPVWPVERCPARGDFEPCVRCCEPDAGGLSRAELARGLAARAAGFQAELAAAALVVVPSRSHAENLARFVDLDPARLALVPHGLPRHLERGGRGAALEWTGRGRLRVLFLGHRSRVKGPLDLVRALAALEPAERERVELLCLGAEVEPGIDDELRREARGFTLELAGPYRAEELLERVAALGGAHLAALPSRVEESYGLVADEALALGLPAWVSDRGAPSERIGAAGRVLPAADPAAWTRAFREVLAAPDKLLAERARVPRTIRTAAEAARELLALYESLVRVP